ncbi:MAG: hypothetical protein RSA66_07840 [Muribaculaceae bacterium]
MKKVLLIILSVSLTACSTQRRVVRTDTNVASKTSTTTNVAVDQSAATDVQSQAVGVSTSTLDLAQDEQVVTEIVEYDTSLPADSLTGAHPVKRKTTQTKSHTSQLKENATAQHTSTTDAQLQQESSQRATEVVDQSVDVNEKVTDKTRKGMTWLQKTLCIIGGGVLLYLAVWLFIKIKTRF